MYNNFEISLMVFMQNITTNHAITYTYLKYRYIHVQLQRVQFSSSLV